VFWADKNQRQLPQIITFDSERISCLEIIRGKVIGDFPCDLVLVLQLFGNFAVGVKDGMLENMDWCKGIVGRTMSMRPPRIVASPSAVSFKAYPAFLVGRR
jgi:hypothetical protein